MPVTVVTVAANTTTGNQAITGAGGTPVLVIIEATRTTTLGNIAAGAHLARGFCDGTNVRSTVAASEDNATIVSGVDTRRRARADTLLQILSATTTTIDGECSFVSMDSGGFTINWTNAPGTAVQLKATMVWGEAWQAAVGSWTGSTTDNTAVSVTGLPFRPRAVIAQSAIGGLPVAAANASMSHGFAALDEAGGLNGQAGTTWFAADTPTVSTCQGRILRNDSVLQRISVDPTTGVATAETRHEITAGNADGFDITTRGGGFAMTGLYIALRNGDKRTWVGTPTLGIDSTGDKTVTPGFPPGPLWSIPTMIPVGSVNTLEDTQHAGMGMGTSCPDGSQAVCAISDEDAVTTSDGYGVTRAAVFGAGLDVSGGTDWSGGVTARGATDFTFNVSNAAAADSLISFLAFEGSFAPGWLARLRRWPRQLGRM